mgnify:FL=1
MAGPLRTVPSVLESFGSSFSAFNAAFNEGQYVFWLGSGISRERVPNVDELLLRVIEHLRSNIVESNADCEYRRALSEVLRLANLGSAELSGIDFLVKVEDWPLKERISSALIPNYSRVLDVLVGDANPDDYLVWTGLDVPGTYGSPDLEPVLPYLCSKA